MAIIRIGKHKPVREALKDLMLPLYNSGVISSIYKSDEEITNPKLLPSVCIFMEEGFTSTESLDLSSPELTDGELVIKVKAALRSAEEGDDYIDGIADNVSELINNDLTLGGLLDADIKCESFEYSRDPNKIYTCIIFRATIEFYDN
jgi:hypothetical protein